MRQRLAHSIDLDIPILPIRETNICGFSTYYSTLQSQLVNYFGQAVSVYTVDPDGNCLYRALSHLIFGTENCFEVLKHKLINKFINSPQHHFNVMRRSGIYSEQELQDHINTVSAPNAWGTDVELRMLGALAGVDTLLTDCTNVDTIYWHTDPNFIHQQLNPAIRSDPIFDGQKLCILHHNLNRLAGNGHFDTLYF